VYIKLVYLLSGAVAAVQLAAQRRVVVEEDWGGRIA
jgi:hypothetical protein